MTDAPQPPSARVRARREARRRARRRGAVILGGGAILLACGTSALVVALTGGGAADAADAPQTSLAQELPALERPLRQSSAEKAPPTGSADAQDSSETQGEAAEVEAEPRVDGLSTSAGSLVAGETVTISGSGLTDVSRVSFGAADAPIVTASETAVEVAVPAAANYAPGEVAVTVEAAGSALSQTTDLTYAYEARTGVDRQLEYALAHWNDYNDAEWGDFNPIGGDCMNFVSQTLAARGWEQRDDWYNDGTTSTETWRYVPTFDTWMAAHAEELGVARLSLDERDQVKLGDLVVFDWDGTGVPDHIQVVSDIVRHDDGTTSVLMVGHNVDSDYRDLDEAITVDHPGASAWFWSIPED